MPIRPTRRSPTIFLTSLVLLVSGCSRAIPVPPRELAPASRWHGRYQVKTSQETYTVAQFAVTDSTLIIEELGGSDSRFGEIELPLVLPRGEVQSVNRLEMDDSKTFLAVLGGGLVAFLLIGLSTWEGPALD